MWHIQITCSGSESAKHKFTAIMYPHTILCYFKLWHTGEIFYNNTIMISSKSQLSKKPKYVVVDNRYIEHASTLQVSCKSS